MGHISYECTLFQKKIIGCLKTLYLFVFAMVKYTGRQNYTKHSLLHKAPEDKHACVVFGTLTLYYELDHSFSRLDVEAVVLAGLAAVGAGHLPGYIDNPQHPIIALRLHAPIRHGHLLISPRPQNDRLGLS